MNPRICGGFYVTRLRPEKDAVRRSSLTKPGGEPVDEAFEDETDRPLWIVRFDKRRDVLLGEAPSGCSRRRGEAVNAGDGASSWFSRVRTPRSGWQAIWRRPSSTRW